LRITTAARGRSLLADYTPGLEPSDPLARATTVGGLSPFARKSGMSPLQPAFLAGEAVRVDAVVGAELADRFGKVVAHGAGREAQLVGDLRRGETLAREAQCLPFALVERIGFVPCLDRERGIDGAATAMHAAQRLRELFGR